LGRERRAWIERPPSQAEHFDSFNTRSRTMNELIPVIAASPLRQRLIDDMTMRRFSRETQRNYLRDV
jgi:hypothetical protein